VSIGLQYGVPLEAYVQKFMNMRFEPSGMTDDTDIRFATSIVDYIFRRLALDHLEEEARQRLGIMSTTERRDAIKGGNGHDAGGTSKPEALAEKGPELIAAPELKPNPEARVEVKYSDAPLCYNCGNKMRPAGSCFVCEGCGSTSGCS
jgi:ribonucleoside-diphosphate reductase alpha chain